MKFSKQVSFVGLLVCVAVVSGAHTENLEKDHAKLQGIIDSLVNSTINALLTKIENPIAFDKLAFNFTGEVLNGDVNVSNFQLYGLKNLVATSINVSVLSLAMNATVLIPQLQLNTKYYADVTLAELVPLYGSGRLGATIDDVELLVKGQLNITSGLSISNVTVSFTLGDAVFDLHGLLNNEDFSALVNEVLNDNLKSFINDNREAISNIISPVAGAIINSLLSGGSNSTQQYELDEALFHQARLQNLLSEVKQG